MSAKHESNSKTATNEHTTFLDSNWSWSDFSSWPLSVKFSPALIAILGIFIAVLFPNLVGNPSLNSFFGRGEKSSCIRNFNYTFEIARAKHHAELLATHDWEIGTLAEANLELITERSVFAGEPFPEGRIPFSWFSMDDALVYVHTRVRLGGPTLGYNNFSAADPASLGVAAVMIGQHWPGWLEAAGKQKDYLLEVAPRFGNGAISHRIEVAELWSDAIFMFPPFLAYQAVATKNLSLMEEAVRQIELYRDVLLIREGKKKGLWKHIVGPSDMADEGAWSTGNAWTAYGMARVRATLAAWSRSRETMQKEITALDSYILEILDGAMTTNDDDAQSGLLRNYLGDTSWFAETSGTALLAAAAYRAGTLMERSQTRLRILAWADRKRRAVVKHVDGDGIAKPAVNPLEHGQREPFEGVSPEGESFLLLMGAARRDCVCAGVCPVDG